MADSTAQFIQGLALIDNASALNDWGLYVQDLRHKPVFSTVRRAIGRNGIGGSSGSEKTPSTQDTLFCRGGKFRLQTLNFFWQIFRGRGYFSKIESNFAL